MLPKDAINETYFISVTNTTHKTCCKFPSESPCLRCTRTSSAAYTFSRSTNKTPSRRWPPIPPCDQQTGPDRTTVNRTDITRQFTSLIALGLIAARIAGRDGGSISRSATLGTSGRGALKRHQCFVAALLSSRWDTGATKSTDGKFGHFKTDKFQTM